MRRCLLATVLMLAACVNVEVDQDELAPDGVGLRDGPTVEFDPASAIIPTPNNLILDPATGLVAVPPQCGESPAQTALREGVLNTLDGFGSFKAVLQISVTEAADPASLADRIVLIRRATDGVPVDAATETPVPVLAFPDVSERFSADCATSEPIDVVRFVPTAPLVGNSTYVALVMSGIQTPAGEAFVPTPTWALVRQSVNPVTVENDVVVAERTPFDVDDPEDLATLLGLDQLWNLYAGALAYADQTVGMDRSDILLAWEFNTQTTTGPLDVDVPGSPAANLEGDPLIGVTSIAGGNPVAIMEAILSPEVCALIGCDAIGDILVGRLRTADYQVQIPNPIGGDPIPGPWSDPLNPALVEDVLIPLLAFVPAAAPPPGGYPTIIFGHGLTRSKEDLFAFAPQLATLGFASIAIDWVAHGDRAVAISAAPELGCSPLPQPSNAPQCYAPFLSSDLAGSRDNLRQSALDAISLAMSLGACTAGACTTLDVDAGRIGFVGQSLGALIGTPAVAMSPDIGASVLNVGGVGLMDVVEMTDTLQIKCPLVDALIAAGIVEGEPSDFTVMPPTGACLGTEWLAQPSYQAFAAVARWIYDPADGANYLRHQDRPVLVQKVVDDETIPNLTTEQQCAFLGLAGQSADIYAGGAPTASAAVSTDPSAQKCVDYGGNPANVFAHSSLLQPADSGLAAGAGTYQMQTDAVTYLFNNLP